MGEPAAAEGPLITARLLLAVYSRGMFPMAGEDGGVYLHDPDPRAVFPLDLLRIDRTTLKVMRRGTFTVTRNRAFQEVMRACADREETWINAEMIDAYTDLHEQGHALSLECWQGDALVGGIYGVHIGTAFFGESMFSRESNAGKVAFHTLVGHLKGSGVTLFDSQYINDFTRQLGAVEIPRSVFRERLRLALHRPGPPGEEGVLVSP